MATTDSTLPLRQAATVEMLVHDYNELHRRLVRTSSTLDLLYTLTCKRFDTTELCEGTLSTALDTMLTDIHDALTLISKE